MENKFNLIDEPWIPVAGVGRVSLRQIFQDDSFKALRGNPVQKIALTKLFLAIAQSAYTPIDDADWKKMGAKGLAEKSLKYLEKWHDRFFLYGEKPFLQFPQVAKAKAISPNVLLPEVSTGNTTVFFQSNMERKFDDGDLALLLIVQMGFALGGKKTDNSFSLSDNYELKSKSSKAGSLVGYQGYLHTLFAGDNIIETIFLNVFTKTSIDTIKEYSEGIGTAPWEIYPTGEDCSVALNLKQSLMGRLMPCNRFCFIKDSLFHITEGIRHPDYQEGAIDPTISLNRGGKKYRVLWVNPSKKPWRDLTAILSFLENNSTGHFECLSILKNIARVTDYIPQIGIWAGGLRVSSNAGEQYTSGNDDYLESLFFIKTNSLGESWFLNLKNEIEILEKTSKVLYGKIKNYCKNLKIDNSDLLDLALSSFWDLCERDFQKLLDSCEDSEEAAVERKKMRKENINKAEIIYDQYCPKETARQIDEWAKNKPHLMDFLND